MDFQVNYGTLDAAAADINTGAANLQNCLDDLEQTLNQLRSSWEGQTQEAYDVAQRRWHEGLERLRIGQRSDRRVGTQLAHDVAEETRQRIEDRDAVVSQAQRGGVSHRRIGQKTLEGAQVGRTLADSILGVKAVDEMIAVQCED